MQKTDPQTSSWDHGAIWILPAQVPGPTRPGGGGMALPGKHSKAGEHVGCRAKGQVAGRERRTSRTPERKQRGGDGAQRDSVDQGNS